MHLSHGLWASVFSASMVAIASAKIEEVHLDGTTLYWIEQRPNEGGRRTIVRRQPDGAREELTPAPLSAASQVHSYGGAAMVVRDGVVYFSNVKDSRIYRIMPGQMPAPLTAATNVRYADLVIDQTRDRLIAVREDHRRPGVEAANQLVSISLKTGRVTVLESSADFYAAPRLSPDGRYLAWIQWHHPQMPWDATQLCVAHISTTGRVRRRGVVIDGESMPRESVICPTWSSDGWLYYASDRLGWWSVYRFGVKQQRDQAVAAGDGDIGAPLWHLGQSYYAFGPGQQFYYAVLNQERHQLRTAQPDLDQPLDWLPAEAIEIQEVRGSDRCLAVLASGPSLPPTIFLFDERGQMIDRIGGKLPVEEMFISRPQSITFPTTDGDEAHGFFYPPCNPGVHSPMGERPPLVVVAHGGPTSATSRRYRPDIQFWTSRGFAVLDVDYRGSSGYGRRYRQRLAGQWGVYDVADCVAGVEYLAARDAIDPERVAIRGGSAGGFTVLCALVFYRTFKAGASYYGISDLSTLSADTHKFESRYLDGLVPSELWAERSPVGAIDQLNCPMILFQGLKDQAVPPIQAEKMVAVLTAKGIDYEYITFPEEGHGFRQAANIALALERELAFFQRVFRLE